MLLDSLHEVTFLEGEEMEQQQKDFKGYTYGLLRLNPGRWLLSKNFIHFANKMYNFKWRNTDVLVMTYPKCGTTWTQEIVWTMRNNPNLDHPYSDDPIMNRAPFLEGDMFFTGEEASDMIQNNECPSFKRLCPGADPKEGVFYQICKATPDPRTIKTHLPFSLLQPSLIDNAKVVYVARNPKDVLLSYLHHSRLLMKFKFEASLEQFLKYFVDGDLLYGAYDKHLKEVWERRNHPNLHFIFYEDLKKNTLHELRRLSDFLGTELTDEQLKKIAEYTSFDQMKDKNDAKMTFAYDQEILKKDGGFFRKGQSGWWKKNLPEHVIAEMDSWMEKHLDFGITFK